MMGAEAEKPNKDHYLDHGEKTVVIVMTSGPSTPHRCATPFYLGALLASMDADVKIFFTMEGVNLVKKGVANTLTAMPGGKRIIEFILMPRPPESSCTCARPPFPAMRSIPRLISSRRSTSFQVAALWRI